jgi:hypothetical protein
MLNPNTHQFFGPAFAYHPPPPPRKIPKLNALSVLPDKTLLHILEFLSPFPHFGFTALVCKRWYQLTERRWGEADVIYFHNVEGKTNTKAPLMRTFQKQELMAANVFKELKLQHQYSVNQMEMQIRLQNSQLQTLQNSQFLNVGDLETVRQHQANIHAQIQQLQNSLAQVRDIFFCKY